MIVGCEKYEPPYPKNCHVIQPHAKTVTSINSNTIADICHRSVVMGVHFSESLTINVNLKFSTKKIITS